MNALRWCRRLALATWACAALAGCAQLLPSDARTALSGFDSFAAAQQALDQVVPFSTTVEALRLLGFDVNNSANVTLIPYPELVDRLAPNPSVPLSDLDAGIRECILARLACQTYEFHLGQQVRERDGEFWADFLNFKRRTKVSGWRLQALIVVRDDVVVFRNYGGERSIARTEMQTNPLGPLQGAGEGAGGLIIK